MNHASRRPSVVPVFPAVISCKPQRALAPPVPRAMTPRMRCVTMNADSAETTRAGAGRGFSETSPASSSAVGHTRTPPLATVANAVVISSSVTSEVPSESEGTAASGLSIPTARATRVT